MPRWLLPLVAVLALCGRTVTAFASAGWVGNTACCCPNPATCKCHDHQGKHGSNDVLKRCGGDAKLVAPEQAGIMVPAPVPVITASVLVMVVELAPPSLVSAIPVPPEPPPI